MNALIVVCLAAVAACTSGQLLGYPGVYRYPGILGAYPTYLPHTVPFTFNRLTTAPITLKSTAPAPITLKTVASAPITLKAVAPTPLSYSVAPIVPVAPVISKYHAQDELGQYTFGYAGGPSSRVESRDALGVVRGSYSYVDPEGQVQTQHYVADDLGFRVAATNLPVAPDASEAVQDTEEVAAQKATLKAAHEEAAAAADAAPASRKKRSVIAAPGFYSPLRFSYGFSAPLQYSHPNILSYHLPHTAAAPAYAATVPGVPAVSTYTAGVVPYTGAPAGTTYTAAAPAVVRDAVLTRVVHNPGHATSYRVE